MAEALPHKEQTPFTPEQVGAALHTMMLGRRIEIRPQVGSTNDLVREAGRRGEQEGLVIAAEEQVSGRGRLGRSWVAPPGCCILCSVLLRPRFSPQQAFYITIAGSLAIYRAARSLGLPPDARLDIKWPNDVLLNGRKVSGVLSESEFSGGEWQFAILGFGINANLQRSDMGELQGSATSLLGELGQEVDRAALLARVLDELESLYLLLQNGRFADVHSAWTARLETLGKHVVVEAITSGHDGGTIEGRAVRVDPDGALVVRTGTTERRVLAGDVRVRSAAR